MRQAYLGRFCQTKLRLRATTRTERTTVPGIDNPVVPMRVTYLRIRFAAFATVFVPQPSSPTVRYTAAVDGGWQVGRTQSRSG